MIALRVVGMDKMKYTFEIRFLQMLLLPPWSMYRIISIPKVRQRKEAGIFLIIWITLQWVSFVTAGTNKIVSFICANAAITMFFLVDLYVGLDMEEFSESEKEILHSTPLKLLVTATSFFIMYSIPNMISRIYLHANIPIFSNTITWTSLHIVLNVILAISWFAFMVLDKYEIFALFPKTEFKDGLYRLIPLTSDKIAAIYFLYIFLLGTFFIYQYIL